MGVLVHWRTQPETGLDSNAVEPDQNSVEPVANPVEPVQNSVEPFSKNLHTTFSERTDWHTGRSDSGRGEQCRNRLNRF
jgi:hypothetical protein